MGNLDKAQNKLCLTYLMKNEINTVFNFHFALYIKKKAHKRQIDNSTDIAHLSDENESIQPRHC